jgi:hypothetical protein
VEPIDLSGVEAAEANDGSVDRRRRVVGVVGVVGAVVVGVVVIRAIARRWWKRGGGRRAVKGLAEVGAVALADVIVGELLPAA